MTTLEQAKNYIRVDFNDDDEFIRNLLDISQIYIDALVGDGYKSDQKLVRLAELLQLLMISDMYDNRSLNTESVNMSKIAHSILDKLSNYTMAT